MLEDHHDLAHELPEFKDKIHDMKTGNAHFKKLFEEYHEVNKEIVRLEKEQQPTSDEYIEELKKKRLSLKDEMAEMLKDAA